VSSLPDTSNLVRRELLLYLEAHSRTNGSLPTRCPPWTVDDVTKHLAATFERFANMLAQGRRGDMTPPFHPDELSRVNLQAVTDFIGDPDLVLADEAETFLVRTLDEAFVQLGRYEDGQRDENDLWASILRVSGR
jgi:hypothetical protein